MDSSADSTIAHFFADRIFDEFPQIVEVAYQQENNPIKSSPFIKKLTILTIMAKLDRHIRRKIYEIQDEAISRFPEYKFNFYVISPSSAVPDSFTLLTNPKVQLSK